MFSKPTPLQAARCELVQAKLALLKAESQRDLAAAQVLYNTERVERLNLWIKQEVAQHWKDRSLFYPPPPRRSPEHTGQVPPLRPPASEMAKAPADGTSVD